MAFSIGDKVVYPMHGAGVIESIEDHEVLGERRGYYIMRLPLGDMKVMIPVENADEIGLRQVIPSEEVSQVLDLLQAEPAPMDNNWNHRYRMHLEKIKSGDIFAVAEVVRNLTLRNKGKGLSTGERKMLESAWQILVSELVLAKGVEAGTVESLLQRVLA